jgi:hypothetical protein
LVLVTLGEALQVQQLPSGHDQVTDRQPECGQAGNASDNLEQQTRRVTIDRHEDVGHEGTPTLPVSCLPQSTAIPAWLRS